MRLTGGSVKFGVLMPSGEASPKRGSTAEILADIRNLAAIRKETQQRSGSSGGPWAGDRAEAKLRSSGSPKTTAEILAAARAQGAAPTQTVSGGKVLLPEANSDEMNRLKTLKLWQTSTKDGKSGWQIFETLVAQYGTYSIKRSHFFFGNFLNPIHKYLTLEHIMQKTGTADVEGSQAILAGLEELALLREVPSSKGTSYILTPNGTVLFKVGNPFLKDRVTPEEWVGLIQLEIEPWEKLLERQKQDFKAVEDALVTSQNNIASLKLQSVQANAKAQTAFADLKALKGTENPDPIALRKMEESVSSLTRLAERLQKQLEIEARADEMQRLDFETGKAKFFGKCREIEMEIDRLHEAQMVIRSTRVSTMLKKLNGTEGTGSTESLSERVTRILATVQAKQETLKGDGNSSGASSETVADANSIVNTLDLEQRLAALNEKNASESLKVTAPIPLNDDLSGKKRVEKST